MKESKAFQEGWDIGFAGGKDSNPYQPDTYNHLDWYLGFCAGRDWSYHMDYSNLDDERVLDSNFDEGVSE